jgi:hypothetical protein
LKEIRQTRPERLLQWHAKNGHENILFMDKKIFTIMKQYNCQNDKIYAQTSREGKEKVPRVERPSPFIHHGLVEGVPSGGDTSSFL